MKSAVPKRTTGMTIVAMLALLQSILGVIRALHWFNFGSDLLGQGLLLFPLVGFLAFFRGALVAAVALAYVLFAYGIFLGRLWARWLGIVVAAVTLLLVVSVVMQGETPARAIVWAIVPLILVGYLSFSPEVKPSHGIQLKMKK